MSATFTPSATAPATAGITRALAALIVGSSYADISDEVRHEAKRAILNWVGCALGGCNDPAVDAALAAVRHCAGPSQATVLGRGLRLDVSHAAFLNVISSNILDFNDTHAEMVVHPTEPVAAPLLALAEYRHVTGAEFLHAFILGIEVECRLRHPTVAEYRPAWTATTTVGAFGAATAAGLLLGLTEQQMTWALGLAATQSCGLHVGGSMSKSFNPAHAARCGLMAAFLAASGFTGSETAIEHGFLEAFGTPKNPAAVLNGWGSSFHLSLNTYKAFPCGAVANPAIDVCQQVRAAHAVRADEIESMSLTVHPVVLELMDRRSPASELQAKVSVYHAAACAIAYDTVGLRQFRPECIQDPVVIALRGRMKVTVDPHFGRDEAHVIIAVRDGRTVQAHVKHAVGSICNPLSDAALEAKARDLAEGALSPSEMDQLIECIWSLHRLEDAGAIGRLAQAARIR